MYLHYRHIIHVSIFIIDVLYTYVSLSRRTRDACRRILHICISIIDEVYTYVSPLKTQYTSIYLYPDGSENQGLVYLRI